MTDKQIINSCEFQSRCIQYKDMYSNKHIKCPIVDFALACRGENKCKYKTVYEQLKAKEQECERLKWYLKEIRYDELKAFDIEWDEYETHCIDSEYSNIINLVEEALKERSSEDCRYDR